MVNIKVIQGRREIGGNCIRIEDKDKILVFDQGIRFSIFNDYFTRNIEPTGIPELRKLNIIPSEEVLECNGIYISHNHLDHLGFLQNIPVGSKLFVPSIKIIELFEKWYQFSSSWLKYVPPRHGIQINEVKPLKNDENNVLTIPVMHSAYPSYSYIYFGSDETILYTGDLRFIEVLDEKHKDLLYENTLLSFLENNRDIKIDTMIIEGTNFGQITAPSDKLILNKLIESLYDDLIFIVVHSQELELILILIESLKSLGKDIVLSCDKLIETLEFWIYNNPKLKEEIIDLYAIIDFASGVSMFNSIDAQILNVDPKKYAILTDHRRLIDVFRLFEAEVISGSSLILLTSEPVNEEAVYEEKVLSRWLKYYGVQPYRLRISGHYYPYEFKKMIEIIKPKEIIPIHTENPDLMIRIYRKMS